MLAILVGTLALVAGAAWITALWSAVSIWRAMPAGHRLRGFFDLGWLKFDSIRELAALQSEMSRFMNGLLEGNGRSTQAWVPAVDVWETEDELVYAFDLPGIPEDGISVEFEDGYDDCGLQVAAEVRLSGKYRIRAGTGANEGASIYD